MAETGVVGLATKKSAIATEVPASVPLRKLGPIVLFPRAGWKTFQLPESVYRNGSSSVTGLVGTTVFCWHCPVKTSGIGVALLTPEKTLFQRPFGQPFALPISLLRVMNCWLPEKWSPLLTLSLARKPPLAKLLL